MANQAKKDILRKVQHTILLAQRAWDNDDVDCNKIKLDLQQTSRSLRLIKDSLSEPNFNALESTLAGLQEQIEYKIRNETNQMAFTSQRDVINGRPGRPKVHIGEDQLRMFHKLNYTAKQMAVHFACSVNVVYKRLYDIGLHQRDKYTSKPDGELDNIIDETQKDFSNAGSVMMNGILQAKGVFVQRSRLRRSIERVNPIPVAQRFGNTVTRRHYQVPMSNSLWHIDGHMKLIRWGISTHGCIDGYSRLIVFLHADTDNKASTVLQHFVKACQSYSVPSRVRSDFGGENVMVSLFMTMMNGQDRHSHITGRSVHNQRIERLWRDVYNQVIGKYYNLFYQMEDRGDLDPDNRWHLLSLQYSFVPDINSQLELFRRGWNSHKLSTERNLSPHQLWLDGVLRNINSASMPVKNLYGYPLAETFEERLRGYGLDPANFVEDNEDEQSNQNNLTTEQKQYLISVLKDEQNQSLRYQKCLDYFETLDINT